MTAAPIRGYCPGCQLSCIRDIVSFNLSPAYSTQLLLLIIAVVTFFPLPSPVFQPPVAIAKFMVAVTIHSLVSTWLALHLSALLTTPLTNTTCLPIVALLDDKFPL